MELRGWILDKSAAARAGVPRIAEGLSRLTPLWICRVGMLEQLYSAQSSADYKTLQEALAANFRVVESPPDLLDRALNLQKDLALHHGMWHRVPIPDLLIAETALYNSMGIVHVDADFQKIARVRPLETRSLKP